MANVQSANTDSEQAMKLGEMQRFKYIPRTHTIEGEYGGYFDRADDGDFVRFSDAQAKSLADERRIEKLEAILKVARDAIAAQPIEAFGEGFIDHGPEYGPEPYPIRDELVYRISAALRVETQESGE